MSGLGSGQLSPPLSATLHGRESDTNPRKCSSQALTDQASHRVLFQINILGSKTSFREGCYIPVLCLLAGRSPP